MPTKFIIKAEVDGERRGTLTRQTREGAFQAAETLLDAFGEETEVSISWEMCGDLSRLPRGMFE